MKTWSNEEDKCLLENYNKVSNETLGALIPNKSPLAIYKKAYKLGLRKDKGIEKTNRSNARKGEKGANWNGGISHTSKGYVLIRHPNHPKANQRGYVLEHILVWERESGSEIPVGCCIHHLNGIKDDNRIENLCLMTCSAHTKHHNKRKQRRKSDA